MVGSIEGTKRDRRGIKEGKSGAFLLICDYFDKVELRLKRSEIVADKSIDFREFSPQEGMLRGRLLLVDGSVLQFMEYLQNEMRLKYRFHLMDKHGKMIFRYDNAPHHNVSTFPHHKHLEDRIDESRAVGFLEVLDEVEKLMANARELCHHDF